MLKGPPTGPPIALVIPQPPSSWYSLAMRIVSLLPSATEILFALGLG
jgi:hypothetical protein